MGRYNFANQQIADLSKNISELTERLNAVIAENSDLRKKIEVLQAEKTDNHEFKKSYYYALSPDVKEKMASICGICVDDVGNVVTTASPEHIHNRFKNLCDNLSKLVLPKCYQKPAHAEGKRKYFSIVSHSPDELSDEQFEIIAETVSAVVELLYYAKKKINIEEIKYND
jgi:hypothetical protein